MIVRNETNIGAQIPNVCAQQYWRQFSVGAVAMIAALFITVSAKAINSPSEFAAGRLAVTRNMDGTLILFYIGMGRDVLYTHQTCPSGGWIPWKRLTNSTLPITGNSLSVVPNQDGRLELFLVGTGNEASNNGGDLLHAWQLAAGGSWSEWEPMLGQNSILSPANGNVVAAARNANGTLVIFIIKPDFGVYYSQQITPGGGWSSWQRLTNAKLAITGTSLAIAQNQDGRLELFLVGTGRDILHAWQTSPNGSWAEWAFLRGQNTTASPHPGTSIAAARNSDGFLEVFALGTNLEVFRCRQLSPGGAWSSWQQMKNSNIIITGTSIAVGQNQDGRLELFLVGTGQDILQAWQITPSGTWTEFSFVKNRESTLSIAVGTNQNGTLEVFNIGTHQEIMHRWQTSPGGAWTEWAMRKTGDWVVTNDVAQTDQVKQRIAKEHNLLNVGSEILAIHAATLPTGKILYFGGSQYSNIQPGNPDYESVANSTRLWNPINNNVEFEETPKRGDNSSRFHDIFCGGHAYLPDGRLLVAGGYGGILKRQGNDANTGLRNTSIYDPFTGKWASAGDMTKNPSQSSAANTGGSWYPTLLTLHTGKVVSMLGSPAYEDIRKNNITVEIFDPQTGSWINQFSDVPTPYNEVVPTYPRLHQLPDGRVFSTSPFRGQMGKNNPQCYAWNPETKVWSVVSGTPANYEFDNWVRFTTSVMLPLRATENYKARVLAVGGVTPQILDLSQTNPSWQNTESRTLNNTPWRYNCNAVLLPNGQVVVVGGFYDFEHASESTSVLAAELYDFALNKWRTLAQAKVPRQYHSVALLLPDGRVWTAGSQIRCEGGLQSRELRIEVFYPPYLFWGPRPTISNAPSSITPSLSGSISVYTPQANSIASVTLIRCGSTTHGFDADQRCIELNIIKRSTSSLTVSIPANNKIAPPGYYFLFIIDSNGVPSVGRAIKVNITAKPLLNSIKQSNVFIQRSYWC
jgi:hypothetical protein